MERDDSAQLCSESSQRPVARRSRSMIPRALSKAARWSRSATPRAIWYARTNPNQMKSWRKRSSHPRRYREPPAVSMTDFSRQAIRQSGYLRAGFADQYDAFRPAPPPVLLDALARYAGSSAPALVVDLGSGTGLSTRAWAERATEVFGIEANPEMRKAA